MDATTATTTSTFIEVSEVWVPEGGRLVQAGGNYGGHSEFAAISSRESFERGEGLPGKAWDEARPVVLKRFDGSYFKRAEAAREAGLTSAVAIPVFAGATLKAVLVLLCADDEVRTGAIEVWAEQDGLLMLDDGYYGAARHFEWVSQRTRFPRGQGLPGGVWAANSPMLMRELGSGYRFIRADSAGKAGLTTGLGIPIRVPGYRTYVLTLLSARGTPIARRFEIWDARASRVGNSGEAVLVDGICEREGPLWSDEKEVRATAWKGLIGQALGAGVPVVQRSVPGIAAGYRTVVALPVFDGKSVSHIVTWYC
ncbi:MAG: GAF domain-containing protein [Pseudomonadota bacterium]|nr:GAF domain-containing protein [Pseudomonadota bacterium]